MTKKVPFLVYALFIAFASFGQVGPVPGCPGAFGPTKIIQGPVTLSGVGGVIQWKKDTVYILKEVVKIAAGNTLRVDAGTIVMAGTLPSKTYLIIGPGAKIQTSGTSTNPVVFTSCRIQGTRQPGDWGGVVVVGKAGKGGQDLGLLHPSGQLQCENGTPNDNSGSMSYTRIEYAGAYFTEIPDNIIYPSVSSLLFMGVGPQTVLQFLQVTDSFSDSYSFLNSTVNGRNLVSWRASDDDFELTAHKGMFQFGLGYKDYNRANDFLLGSNGIECKWEKGISSTTKISNFELWGPTRDAGTPLHEFFKAPFYITHNAKLSIYNSMAAAWPTKTHTTEESSGGPPSGCMCNFGYEVDQACSQLACPPPECCVPLRIVNGQNSHYDNISGFMMNVESYQNFLDQTLKFKKNVVAAYPTYATTVCASGGDNLSDAGNAFKLAPYKNTCTSDLYNYVILQKKAPLKEEPLFALKPGSPLLAQSSFADASLSADLPLGFIFQADTNARGFANVAYVGAFGGTEWTQGWTEYNPNVLKYVAGTPPTKQGEIDAFLTFGPEAKSLLLSCYPNPSSGGTLASFTSSSESVMSAYNLKGEEIMPPKVIMAGATDFFIETDTWPSGFYFVKLKDAFGQSAVAKLCVAH